MTDSNERWMREALREAKQAYAEGETPVGAVVVHEDRIIGRGHNQTERLQDPTAHAEMIAITAAAAALESWRLLDCTLYVTVEPCLMCAGACALARIPRLVFGTRDPKFGALCSLFKIGGDERLNHTFQVQEGVLGDEAAALMQSFFKKRRKRPGKKVNGAKKEEVG